MIDGHVAVVGAGPGGLAAGFMLKRAGIDSFTIFERGDGVGGTWRYNAYPGSGCDVPSQLYSFSFAPNDWSRTHAGQPEILEYLERCADEWALVPHLRLNTAVTAARWDVDAELWRLTTSAARELTFRFVISAVGLFTTPNISKVPGTFQGRQFHTARWEHDYDLAGKRVAVVGTGSTAAQVVPAIADEVEHVYLFQRQAGWVLPKHDRDLSPRERGALGRPLRARLERARIYLRLERYIRALRPESATNRKLRQTCLQFLEETIESPELRASLTPSHPYACKRPVVSSDYYPALNRPNVELVSHAVSRMTGTGVVAEPDVERAVDAIIWATGFDTTDYLGTMEVTGSDGRRLRDAWADGAEALLGMAVPGFPNLFILYGPNTNSSTTSIIFVLERQVSYLRRVLLGMARSGDTCVEARRGVTTLYNRWIQASSRNVAMNAGCHNYFRAASGKFVTNWPRSSLLYWAMTRLPWRLAFRCRPRARTDGRVDGDRSQGMSRASAS